MSARATYCFPVVEMFLVVIGLTRAGELRPGVMLLVATLLIMLALLMMERSLRPVMLATAGQKVQIEAVQSINQAVLEKVVSRIKYTDLYLIQKNSDNYVTFMQPNTTEFNRVASDVALAIQEELGNLEDKRFSMPLGQVLGSHLFATAGPRLTVGVRALGPVHVEIDSQFHSAGINQTRHIVRLHIKTDMQVVVPLWREKLPVEQTLDLAEGIIAGPVPKTVVDFQWGASNAFQR